MLFVLGSIWALPNSLVGLLYICVGWAYPVEFSGGVWRWVAAPFGLCRWVFNLGFGAITFGNLQIYSSLRDLENESERRHENRHTRQTHLMGPLFVPIYLAASFISLARGTGFYWGNYFEADARRAAEQ